MSSFLSRCSQVGLVISYFQSLQSSQIGIVNTIKEKYRINHTLWSSGKLGHKMRFPEFNPNLMGKWGERHFSHKSDWLEAQRQSKLFKIALKSAQIACNDNWSLSVMPYRTTFCRREDCLSCVCDLHQQEQCVTPNLNSPFGFSLPFQSEDKGWTSLSPGFKPAPTSEWEVQRGADLTTFEEENSRHCRLNFPTIFVKSIFQPPLSTDRMSQRSQVKSPLFSKKLYILAKIPVLGKLTQSRFCNFWVRCASGNVWNVVSCISVSLYLIQISIPLICRSGTPVDESTQSRLSRQIEDLLRCVLNTFSNQPKSQSDTDVLLPVL